MKLTDVVKNVINPGLALLPDRMDTPEARAMLIAIGLQESRFKYRKQIGGPAHGFYQFENGGGVKGVLKYHSTKPIIEYILRSIRVDPSDAYNEIVSNDPLATVFARLLLWTDPGRIPAINCNPNESWDLYLRTWKPGKPHRDTWDQFWLAAVATVKGFEPEKDVCPTCGK